MGAKNLKAVVARDPPPKIPPALRELRERAMMRRSPTATPAGGFSPRATP